MPTEGTQYEYADDPKLMSERMRATREALDEVKGGMLSTQKDFCFTKRGPP
jgi:hypothetical protein